MDTEKFYLSKFIRVGGGDMKPRKKRGREREAKSDPPPAGGGKSAYLFARARGGMICETRQFPRDPLSLSLSLTPWAKTKLCASAHREIPRRVLMESSLEFLSSKNTKDTTF